MTLTAEANLIVRKVKIDRTRTPQEALDATGCMQYTDRTVVSAMPTGEGDEVEVVFFKPDLSKRNNRISNDDLKKEFALHGLKPADSYSLAAVNEAYPAFVDEHSHGTHWKNAEGNWCYAAFRRWVDGRRVDVGRVGHSWGGHGWWFAGLRLPAGKSGK